MTTDALQERVNTGRQPEVDIAKGLAILFMVLVHTLEMFANTHARMSYGAYMVIQVLGAPFSAPVFMFALGVGLVYSRKNTPGLLARRGLFLLAMGYALNILRDGIPYLLHHLHDLTPDVMDGLVSELINVDILGFAAVMFLFWALLRRLGLKDRWLAVLWALLGIARELLAPVRVTSIPARIVTSYFWGSCSDSYFPFILWMFYPVAGYFFGKILICSRDKKKLYRHTALVGLAAFAVSSAVVAVCQIELGQSDVFQYDYFHHGLVANVWYGSIVLVWLSVCFAVRHVVKGPLARLIFRWSRNINALFFLQWVILGVLHYCLFTKEEASLLQVLLLSCAVLAASDFLSHWYLKWWRALGKPKARAAA